jgi:hypothetical protein
MSQLRRTRFLVAATKALGITISQAVLLCADRVIEWLERQCRDTARGRRTP